MPASLASVLRVCGVAFALILGGVRAAEPVSPLIGATLEQVVAKYGEPKSQITVGDRLVIFYPKERIVVRGGRVIEVEQLAAEPVRRPEPPATVPANSPTSAAGPNAGNSVPGAAASPGTPASPEAVTPAVTQPQPASESKVEIKLVRPPSANGRGQITPLPAPKEEVVPVAPVSPPLPVVERNVGPTKQELAAQAAAAERVAELAAKNKRAKATSSAVRRLDFAEGSALEDEGTPAWRYVLLAVVVIGGLGFFIWRWRQGQADLAATSVKNTPVRKTAAPVAAAPVAAPVRARETAFSADFISRLDAAQFETLVTAYYSKTGVVAVRATDSASGLVRVRISWKGEPRPFAGVLCLGRATALIDANPLRELAAALVKEDIRRGHVVTTGKFAPAARDFAAENQLTLLPGDTFLEKLNALPESARAEIMRTVAPANSAA